MCTTKFNALPPAALKCWRLEWLMIMGGLMAGLLLWRFLIDDGGGRLLLLHITLAVALLLLFLLWFCGLSYRRHCWRLADEVLVIRRGALFRKETLVARERVQYVDVQQSPLYRRHGLALLVIFTAGAQLPAIRLDGVAIATALALRAALTGEDHD